MATSYSARSRAIEPFHVMALLARANELQAAGHDVIHLEIGEPDFTTAKPIVEAGRAALAAGHTRYTAARGLPALREAIAKFYGERYGVDLDPQRVLVTPGGSGALLLASSLLVDPGRHWLLADPGYPCNRHFLRLVEGAAQLVPVGPDSRYQLTPDLIERHWDSDSVGALVATPANPTGTLLDRDELAGLSGALKARGGHLVVDEIYHGLTYGVDATSVLEVDDDAFVLNSFSKYFGMTGWRLGWLVAPAAAVPEPGEAGAEPLHQRAEHGPAGRAGLFRADHHRHSRRASRRVRPPSRLPPAGPARAWVSESPWSRKAPSISTPISVRSAAMPTPSASTSSRPSTWPSLRGWISAATRPATTCVSPIPRTCRACRKRWSGSPAA